MYALDDAIDDSKETNQNGQHDNYYDDGRIHSHRMVFVVKSVHCGLICMLASNEQMRDGIQLDSNLTLCVCVCARVRACARSCVSSSFCCSFVLFCLPVSFYCIYFVINVLKICALSFDKKKQQMDVFQTHSISLSYLCH